MQAFIKVCDDKLPVCMDIVSDPLMQTQFRHAPGSESGGQISKLDRERLRTGTSVEEDVAIPEAGMKFVKRVVQVAECGRIHMGRSHEAAIKSVGPTVVRALNPSREITRRRRTQACAAMAADVIERLYGSGTVANDDEAFARDLAQEIISSVWNGVCASRAYPIFEKEGVNLPAKMRRIRVVTRR